MAERDQHGGEDRERIEREFLERMQREMLDLEVQEYVTGMMRSLPSIAFMRMGLTEESRAGRDLGQARLAIDVFRALLEVMGAVLPGDEVGMYRGTLAQMQMAYVGAIDQESDEAAGGPEAGSEPSAEETEETEPEDEGADEQPAPSEEETDGE